MVNVQRRHGQVKKPICISEYNMFMKGDDRAKQYMAYYSLPRKAIKWGKFIFGLQKHSSFYAHFIANKMSPQRAITSIYTSKLGVQGHQNLPLAPYFLTCDILIFF
jgi:hypothetical protein